MSNGAMEANAFVSPSDGNGLEREHSHLLRVAISMIRTGAFRSRLSVSSKTKPVIR
jgi:hypothetical protein